MKSIKRILATALMLVMIVSLFSGAFSVSAASDVTCTGNLVVVDDDFGTYDKGDSVSAVVAGKTYKGKLGTTAFATIQEAYAKVEEQGSIYVAAGVYAGDLAIDKSVSLYGNKMDVNPNESNDPAQAADDRAVTGPSETILQDMAIFFKEKALEEILTGSYALTINGFAVAGDSCIYMQGERLANARINISNNVFDIVNESVYSDIGAVGEVFSAISVGIGENYTFTAAELIVENNRIEKVVHTGSGKPICNAITTSWVLDQRVQGNYFANTSGDLLAISQLGNTTEILDNYFYNGAHARVFDNIKGIVDISGNTFDTVGGTSANGEYALGVYAEATASNYINTWPIDTNSVLIHANTFKNVGKAIRLYGRLRENAVPINSAPYGAQIYDNAFEPVAAADCTFIHMSYSDGLYAPPVYNNYTAGRNPRDICIIDTSDASAKFDFGAYWLNEEMTDSSTLLDVVAITNENGISFAGAKIEKTPVCTIAATIPASIADVTLGLQLKEGAYYELFSDSSCTTPLVNNTISLGAGEVTYAYAKVHYDSYSAVYTILLTRKIAFTDYLPVDEIMVSTEFAQYPTGQPVYVEVEGQWYRAIVGHSAFHGLSMALASAQSGDTIHLAAGTYSEAIAWNKGVIVKGPKAGINPNNMNSSDYTRSDERADLDEEAIFTVEMSFNAGINGITFDGVTFTEKARFIFPTTFQVKGMNFLNMLFVGSTAEDSLLYRGRNDQGKNTMSDAVVANCRFEGNGTAYIMRYSNISNGLFEGNVFYNCNKSIYIGGIDGSASDVLTFKDNIFYAFTSGIALGDATNTGVRCLASVKFDGNKFINCTSGSVVALRRWRSGTTLTVVNNRFEGTSKGTFLVNPEPGFSGQTIKINYNYYGSSVTTALDSTVDTVADCSHNYFENGPASAVIGLGTYVPYYTDAEMTKLAGAYEIVSINAPAGATFDNNAKTITCTNTTALDELALDMSVTDGASYKLYKDAACTEEINGKIALNGQSTTAYAKVIAEDGVTSALYTISITQPASDQAVLKGIAVEGSTWVKQGATTANVVLPKQYVKGPIIPVTSAGATASVYAADDTELKNPIIYNTDINIPVGKTTYIIKVVSEDGSAEAVYTVSLTRSKSDACELLNIKDGIEDAIITGSVANVTYANEVEKVLPKLVVSDGATYELYADVGANVALAGEVALTVDEITKVYAKVIAEDGTTESIYTLNLTRQDQSAENNIIAEAFPDFAISQAELDADATGTLIGLKRLDNNAREIHLQPKEFVSSLEDKIVVSEGATYQIFKNYDPVTGNVSGKLSDISNPATLKVTEGTNIFYVRVNAQNGVAAIYTLYFYNEIKNVSAGIISINGFTVTEQTVDANGVTTITASAANDNPQIDIFVSNKATAKVYADRKKTIPVAATMTTYTVTDTQVTYTDCKLDAPMSQPYVKLYVDVTAQAGGTASYILKLTSSRFANTFTDIEGHWAEKYITDAYLLGVTNGNPAADGSFTFNPQDNATREQIAVFVCNLMGINAASYNKGTLPYADAKKISSWARNAVRAVTALNIMTGDGKNFNPKANISRQEFMAVMVRAAGLDTSKGKASHINKFTDKDQIASWAKIYVQTAVAYGLVNGDDKGRVNPIASITRAEIVKIMVCAKDYVR